MRVRGGRGDADRMASSRSTRLLSVLAHPVLLSTAVIGAWLLLRGGVAVAVTVGAINVGAALVVATLERLHPHRAAWNDGHGDTRTDVLHVVFAMLPVPVLFRAVALGALTSASVWLAQTAGTTLWPRSWPLAAQLLLALCVGEVGQYCVHRLAHEWTPLWRLHAVHHSVERLYWLNAARFHPLDTLLQHAAELAPLILLGASDEVIALYTVFTATNGMLRHANVELRTGALSWVLSTADLHRWHHAQEPAHSNANYGANLILIDVVLGTRKLGGTASPTALGLPMRDFPRDFGGLLLAPFLWRW
jgi:ornithine lipid hydroxylase